MKKNQILSKLRLGFGILISLLFILLGLLPLKGYIKDALEVHKASQWISATGTVKTEKVVETSDRYGNWYNVEIGYQFSANDRLFTGNRYAIPDVGFDTKDEAQSILIAHPLESIISIYYDSKNPDYSSIQNPKGNLLSAVLHVIGLVAVIFLGVFLLRYQIKNKKIYS